MKRAFRIISTLRTTQQPLLVSSASKFNYAHHVKSTSAQFSTSSNRSEVDSDWRTWFQSQEYQPIWTTSTQHGMGQSNQQLLPLSHKELDNLSKFLLSRLDEITYNSSTRITTDIPTTQECNAMMQRIKEICAREKNVEGGSHRAYMIWKKMEHCVDIRQDMQIASEKRKFQYDLPKPNRETYRNLLMLHATDKDKGSQKMNGTNLKTLSAPERAMEILLKMEERFEEGNWDAEPTVMMWNQVLATWTNSDHPQKSYKAAEVLRGHIGEKADASSYGQVFKACASTQGGEKAQQLAVIVAMKLWDEMQVSFLPEQKEKFNEQIMERSPHMIAFAMKAVALSKDETARDCLLKSQFDLASELGIVNTHILQIFKTKASDKIVSDCLGKYKRKKATGTFHSIPQEWKRNTKAFPSGW